MRLSRFSLVLAMLLWTVGSLAVVRSSNGQGQHVLLNDFYSHSSRPDVYGGDSVIIFISRRGYEVDVLEPGRYVVARNFAGVKVSGKVRILNRRTLAVGRTVVPLSHVRSITVKSSLYPFSKAVFDAGKNLAFKFTGKMFKKLGFSSTGPAAILLLVIGLLVAFVFVILGLLLMFVALPGIMVGKRYDVRNWKILIKPRRR